MLGKTVVMKDKFGELRMDPLNDCEFRSSNLSSVNCDKSEFIGSTFGH